MFKYISIYMKLYKKLYIYISYIFSFDKNRYDINVYLINMIIYYIFLIL